MEVARVADEGGWSASLVRYMEVVSELRYWRENLRRLNGQPIRMEAGVQVLRPQLQVNLAREEVSMSSVIKALESLNIEFEIVWQSRNTEEIWFADKIFKDFDFGDYRISSSDFCGLVNGFGGFSADYFGFFHPPVGLVHRVLEKVREDRARGILLVPDWPGSMVMLEIRQSRQLELKGRLRPGFQCSDWFQNSTFRGIPKFDMLLFEMDF